jgi:ectoine hydroxylase-related dioxygenase (phytanoyl-CoA dioxygenase family)
MRPPDLPMIVPVLGEVDAQHTSVPQLIAPSAAERRALDEQGFVLLSAIIDPAWLEDLRVRFDELAGTEGAAGGQEVHTEAGTQRLSDLVNKGAVFDRLWSHPRVLGCVAHILGQDTFRLSSLNAREALPGQGHQNLHADWGGRDMADPWCVTNTMWLLDDYDGHNGSTRIVPGTHLLPGGPADHLVDLTDAHPKETIVTAAAGTVIVFNAHCWHGGTRNANGRRRRVCHGYYTRRNLPQQTDQRAYLRPETRIRLTAAQRWILDVG